MPQQVSWVSRGFKEGELASSLARRLPMVLGALLLVAPVFTAYTAQQATATHMPADKVAAAGSSIDQISDATPILSDTMKVSSPSDLILSVTAECSILTALSTEGTSAAGAAPETDNSEGKVEIWVTIDGTTVPVSTADLDPVADGVQTDDGHAVFCNREYERSVANAEDDDDGFDSERDYIRTRTANAFNWLAIDTGTAYDSPTNGNNILDIVVYADFTHTPVQCTTDDTTSPDFVTCSDAFVGARTLIVEPTKLSIHEQVTPTESD